MENNEDQRVAATIHAGISSQIFAASLVLIGIFLGYFDIHEIGFWKAVAIIFGVVLLSVSLIFAGVGLKQLREKGMNGVWSLDDLHFYFRTQTRLNFVAIAIFFVVFFIPNRESTQQKFENQLKNVETENLKYDSLAYEQERKELDIMKSIETKLDSTIYQFKIKNKLRLQSKK